MVIVGGVFLFSFLLFSFLLFVCVGVFLLVFFFFFFGGGVCLCVWVLLFGFFCLLLLLLMVEWTLFRPQLLSQLICYRLLFVCYCCSSFVLYVCNI